MKFTDHKSSKSNWLFLPFKYAIIGMHGVYELLKMEALLMETIKKSVKTQFSISLGFDINLKCKIYIRICLMYVYRYILYMFNLRTNIFFT